MKHEENNFKDRPETIFLGFRERIESARSTHAKDKSLKTSFQLSLISSHFEIYRQL